MSVILTSKEDQERSLAHGLVLCTQDEADDYLMHYRVGGEKTGIRRWQDESGRLTNAGYAHYAEMYGWGKRLQKAHKLQGKADNAKIKAEKKNLKADKLTARNGRSWGYNSKLTEREKTAIENAKIADAKARVAQSKATKYADKLQRKEDREAKYRNEDGSLNEEGLRKYTSVDPNTGERKMNLLGRAKFGNEYSDKFNKQEKEASKKNSEHKDSDNKTEETKKTVLKSEERDDPAGAEFNGDPEHDSELREAAKDKIEYRVGLSRDWFHDEEYMDEAERVASLKYLTENESKLQDKARKNFGDDILSYINDPESSQGEDFKHIESWLLDSIDKKSGNWNVGEFRKGTNGEKAYNKLNEEYDKELEQEDKIKKDIGYKEIPYDRREEGIGVTNQIRSANNTRKREQEYQRLQQALKNDSVYQALSENSRKAENDLCGAVLKDLGFRDTPENRYLIESYIFIT